MLKTKKKKKEMRFFFFFFFLLHHFLLGDHLVLDMLAHSPRDRSRSPHSSNGTSSIKQLHHLNPDEITSNQIESTSNSKTKKETETQQRLRNLKVNEKKIIPSILFLFRHSFKH
jgi:hypothetical protein